MFISLIHYDISKFEKKLSSKFEKETVMFITISFSTIVIVALVSFIFGLLLGFRQHVRP